VLRRYELLSASKVEKAVSFQEIVQFRRRLNMPGVKKEVIVAIIKSN
jgi:hypothetical protein